MEIISVHDKSAKSIAEVEEKIKPLRDRFWDGKDIPFPILLDAENKTFQAYGARGWPTTLLLDPEGKMVGRYFSMRELEKLVPILPKEAMTQLLLESTPNWGFDGISHLGDQLKGFGEHLGINVEFADDVAHLSGSSVPLTYSSGSTLVAYLSAMLEPVGLDFEARARTIRIVKAGKPREKTAHSEFADQRIKKVLEKSVDETFNGELRNLIPKVAEWTSGENMVPDPLSIMQGKLDIKAKVTLNGDGKTLRQALTDAVRPLGLYVEIRNEAIYLVSKEVKKP